MIELSDLTTMPFLTGMVVGGTLMLALIACLMVLGAGSREDERRRLYDEAYQAGRGRGAEDARIKYAGLGSRLRRDRGLRPDQSEEVAS